MRLPLQQLETPLINGPAYWQALCCTAAHRDFFFLLLLPVCYQHYRFCSACYQCVASKLKTRLLEFSIRFIYFKSCYEQKGEHTLCVKPITDQSWAVHSPGTSDILCQPFKFFSLIPFLWSFMLHFIWGPQIIHSIHNIYLLLLCVNYR